MLNETGATDYPEQTALPVDAQPAAQPIDSPMETIDKPPLQTQLEITPDGTTGPAPGRQPARKTA